MTEKMELDQRQTDEEILKQYSVEDMHKAVEEKLNGKNRNSKFVLHADFGRTGTLKILSAAAVLMLTILLPVSYSGYRNRTTEIRSKGTGKVDIIRENNVQQLNIYKNNNGNIELLENGSKIDSGELIQLSYSIPHSVYGMIISIDGNGSITRHYPEMEQKACLLTSGKQEVFLSTSYELDNAPYYERFLLITSDKIFDSKSLELAVSTMKVNQAKRNNLKSYLPKDAQVTSILLIKN